MKLSRKGLPGHTRTVSLPRRRALAWVGSALAATALMVLPTAAIAAYPDKPIRLVVPFPPGGAVDFYARVVQPALGEVLGQPVIIENKAGASGMVGAALVAQAPPDGYTLLLGNIASLAINVGIYAKMPYDPRKDLTHIVRTVDVNYVMVVHPSVPAKTVPEFIAYAKANAGKVAYGTAGNGSLPHLGTESFKAMTGTEMTHVPYKGGGPLVTDLLGGQIQVAIADQANLMPHVQSGKLRALAVATAKRSPNAPDLPTIAESLPGFEATAWQGLAAPAGLAPDVTKKINEAFNKVMAMPAVRDKLMAAGLAPVGGTPDQFSRFIDSEINKWTKIAKDVGATAD
ncbi:tripartite tricarboxylate transporter substrate binding protein [Comamonadaceae bacterium G21597-S1]|nr:tripartite tricarboxylate transporter substrate binding protein [Comamonadaceae bacterium G21597-S1]